jgi:ABC-type antimicrobial peptide transport system permease subunit
VTNPDPTLDGPTTLLVRLPPHVSAAAGRAEMQKVLDAGNKAFAADPDAQGDTVNLLDVQRPAEIVNYRSTGATPLVLAAGLAGGAVAALGLTLVASVRRRRRDLGLLKTLGFTGRQLTSAIAWQASVVAVIGLVAGVPLGIVLGRQLWIVFAHQIYAVPKPTVPWSAALVVPGALLLTNVVAAIPGRMARRTPAALVLRTE